MLKINTGKKYRYRYMLIYFFIVVFGIFTYSLDLYPGGHQIDYFSDTQSITLTKKDIFHSEQYKIDKTEISTLKVALIEYELTFLKELWLVGIFVIGMLFVNLLSLLDQDKTKPTLLIYAIYIIIFIVGFFVYIDRLNFMNEVIGELIV